MDCLKDHKKQCERLGFRTETKMRVTVLLLQKSGLQ